MVGERIKLARRKAGLSLQGLSDRLGGSPTPQAIGKYERGETVPSSVMLQQLAAALNVSVSYLMDAQGVELSAVEFRKHASTTARERAHVHTVVLDWIERYLEIELALELPSADWQRPLAAPRQLKTIDGAEALAEDVRATWNLGLDPIPSMTELLEEKGLKVLIQPFPLRVSGFTCIVKRPRNQPDVPVIVVNSAVSLERRRLTLAHELAHRLIEPDCLSEKDEEKAATIFASAFLMPRTHLKGEVGARRNALGYSELIELKRRYRVSGAALLMRLRHIGTISDATLIYAFQSIARTWRTQEPHELEPQEQRGEYEKPTRFDRLCYRALAEGLISLTKASELLRQSVSTVELGLRGPSAKPSGAG
ncbi:MAG TPA: XRE family transcriptional regulator [Burkholderiales bacterium]|nr:XRE family transcriptional regulator [Burkholderiales bacterium]